MLNASPTRVKRASGREPETVFLDNLALIERLSASICRRHGFHGADVDEFASTVKLKLIEDGYGRLRKYAGRGSLKAYLAKVIGNFFRDYRISRWGRWRPSAAAKRLGDVAVQLETFLYRDGHTFDETVRLLQTNFKVPLAEDELADLAIRLPQRTTRRFEDDTGLETVAVEAEADEMLVNQERAVTAAKVETTLAQALGQLPDDDRRLLRLHFQEGLTLAAIAKTRGLNQRRLYRRKERCEKQLRQALTAEGLGAEVVSDLLGWEGTSLRVSYA